MTNTLIRLARRRSALLVLLLTCGVPAVASADAFTLAWDANPEPGVIGYVVYIGTTSGAYSTTVDVGPATTYTFSEALPGTTYYASVAAYVAGPVYGARAAEIATTTGGAPTLSNPGNRTSARGAAISLKLTASDPNGDPITFSALGLPTGLTVNPASGVISGTPTTAGVFKASVTASDPTALVTTQYFTWTIVASDLAAPTIAITAPTAATAYSTTAAFVTVSGVASDDVGVVSVAWANSAGGAGTVAGTTAWSVVVPVVAGANTLTVVAKDASNKTSSDTLTVTMTATADLPPTITISKPTTAVTYASAAAVLALEGTASDKGSVTKVTWSNDRGGSGTATGTTGWHARVALQRGTNVVRVTAFDNAGKTATDTVTVTYAAPSGLTITALKADKPAPQALRTAVTFTVSANGGIGPIQYKWLVFDGNALSVRQAWSTSPRFSWRPWRASANYRVIVWARSAGSSKDEPENMDAQESMPFPISGK